MTSARAPAAASKVVMVFPSGFTYQGVLPIEESLPTASHWASVRSLFAGSCPQKITFVNGVG